MNKTELKKYKNDCNDAVERARDKGRTIVKSICPNCFETLETIVAHKSTWNNRNYDLITKACYDCGNAHFLKIYEKKTEAFEIDNDKVIHVFKQ